MRHAAQLVLALLLALPSDAFSAFRVAPVHVAPAHAGAYTGAAAARTPQLATVLFSPSTLLTLPALANTPLRVAARTQASPVAVSAQPQKTHFAASKVTGDSPKIAPDQRGKTSNRQHASAPKTNPTSNQEALDEIVRRADEDFRTRLGRFSKVFDGSRKHYGAPIVRTDADHSAIARKIGPRTDYLRETESLSGTRLLSRLHEISGRGYKTHDYKEAKSELFSNTDNFMRNGKRGVIAAYSDVFVPGRSGDGTRYGVPGDANGDGYNDRQGMNVEHLWPQSYFNRGNPMRSDLHHLMATFAHPNSERDRYPFGEVLDRNAQYRNNAGAKLGGGYFEPPDSAKGRVARGLLYFYMRYNNRNIIPINAMRRFWDERIDILLKWNRKFPPDAFEMRRNDLVEEYQGNRNPFVDNPLLADRIGKDALIMNRRRTRQAIEFPEESVEITGEPVFDSYFRAPKTASRTSAKKRRTKNRGHHKKKRKNGR